MPIPLLPKILKGKQIAKNAIDSYNTVWFTIDGENLNNIQYQISSNGDNENSYQPRIPNFYSGNTLAIYSFDRGVSNKFSDASTSGIYYRFIGNNAKITRTEISYSGT